MNKDINDKEQEEFNAIMNRLFMIEALPKQTSINEIKKKQWEATHLFQYPLEEMRHSYLKCLMQGQNVSASHGLRG